MPPHNSSTGRSWACSDTPDPYSTSMSPSHQLSGNSSQFERPVYSKPSRSQTACQAWPMIRICSGGLAGKARTWWSAADNALWRHSHRWFGCRFSEPFRLKESPWAWAWPCALRYGLKGRFWGSLGRSGRAVPKKRSLSGGIRCPCAFGFLKLMGTRTVELVCVGFMQGPEAVCLGGFQKCYNKITQDNQIYIGNIQHPLRSMSSIQEMRCSPAMVSRQISQTSRDKSKV